MEYDIIEKVNELAASGGKLEERLESAARLFALKFHFDECLFFLAGEGGALKLAASSSGLCTTGVLSYGKGEGLPALAVERGALVEAQKEPRGAEWEGIPDRGLEGVSTALVYPLGGKAPFGVIYLKSRERTRPSLVKKQLLKVAAIQASLMVRNAALIEDHRKAHSELMEIQARLASSEKLLALGDMAATMAHEIRNPLLSIGGYAARLKRQLPPGSPGLVYLDKMSHEIGRIEKIMNGIIRFLKDNLVELKPDDLNGILDEALNVFADEFSAHGITVERRSRHAPLPVLADREQMKIAFDNIIANAIQSMEKGGALRVVTSRSGDFAVAEVSDTGGGIDPKHIGNIFNPFFTTKKHGTGLGLPIANSIITRHRGGIEVRNEGRGASFTIKLPYSGAARPGAGVPPVEAGRAV
ncbi:MAG: ATP-binding protein [Thermodesulfobacteriota bacterium]|nr:MAG: ATP-binding protein [Thermodesulfobacteriota bacterium]